MSVFSRDMMTVGFSVSQRLTIYAAVWILLPSCMCKIKRGVTYTRALRISKWSPFHPAVPTLQWQWFVNFTVKVYCICRMPQGFKFMVSCDSCSEWYHRDFVTIPQEIRENENKEVVWQCPRCQPVCNLHNVMHLCVNPGSDFSPEDSIFAAARTHAVVIKKTKPRGCKPSHQDCDKGTAKNQTDSNQSPCSERSLLNPVRVRVSSTEIMWLLHVCVCILLFPGSDSSPEDSNLADAGIQAMIVKNDQQERTQA